MLAAVLAAVATGCAFSEAPHAQLSGLLTDDRLDEVSGLAASRRHDGTLWVHNDGGNGPHLYAIGARGALQGRLTLDGADNTDWEDMAAFRLDGRDYLLVADVGDNGGLRHTLQLHVIEEPAELSGAMRAAPAWSIAFRWPDGARDCEAVAVDAASGRVLLVSKKRQPPELFAVPLRPAGDGVQVAEALGTLAHVPAPSDLPGNGTTEAVRGQVTAADLSPDGRELAVLTYDEALVYARRDGEPWAAAVARPPRRQPLPLLPQAEALAWRNDGRRLHATGEFRPAPLFLVDPAD
ncbi:hypothetical protein GCM10028862_13690 [Luteimonas pelagia]